ncbi:MAG: YihY/virulence factor BrkB family protein [Proteobacteria bacterium]|nr:YihY/virulence factor BrkB family protein [Pseudomonadota bacterium]
MNFFLDIFKYWSKDKIATLAAAFAYFTIFSLVPLLVICIAIAGLVLSKSAAEQQILSSLNSVIGSGGSQLVAQMINSQTHAYNSIIAAVIGMILVIIGAIGFYGQLLDGLNAIWEVQTKSGLGVWGVIRSRLFAFLAIIVMGIVFLLAIISSTLIGKFAHLLHSQLLVKTLHVIVSIGIITFIFILMYKFLPDVEINFGDVWLGALFSAILFVISQVILGWYFSHASMKSQYGVAGSLIVIILWLYYLGQIIFLGAEFIKVYVVKRGHQIQPSDKAAPIRLEKALK